MTIYYQIEADYLADFGVTQEPSLPGDVSFIDGELISEKLQTPLEFKVNYPADEEPPHLISDIIPVLSHSLIDTINSTGVDNYQAYPAILTNPETGKSWDNYSAFNAVGLYRAANLDKSDFDTLMSGSSEGVNTPLLAFRVIVLDSTLLKDDLLMFRLAESPEVLIVHEKVVEQIKKQKPPGGWNFDVIKTEVQ